MSSSEMVTSPANPLIKDVRRAIARGGMTDEGCVVAEGFHLLEEALRSKREVPVVLASEAVASIVERHVRGLKATRTVIVPEKLFGQIASTEASQGVMALVKPREWKPEQLFHGRSLVVVLDGLQDPGNAGAIVRAAEAFGASGVMFLKGTASPLHPKTLRASAGSLFRVPYVAGLTVEMAVAGLRQHGVEVFAAMPAGAKRKLAGDADFAQPCAIVIGSEGRGVSEELARMATEVAIPTTGVESLNAAVAAAVLLYEARRQRVQR